MTTASLASILVLSAAAVASAQDAPPVEEAPPAASAGSLAETDPLFGDPLAGILRPLREGEAWTKENHGLSWNIYYTLLYQHATRTVTDPSTGSPFGRDVGTGRLDLGFNWSAFETPGAHGEFGFLVRSGTVIGQDSTYRVGAAVGSMPVGPDALYWGDDTSLCLAYWQQGFMNDDLVFTFGKVHPNQYIALSKIANDESRQFSSGTFDGLNTLGSGLGTYAPGLAFQATADSFYFNAVVIDAAGGPNTGISSIGDGNWWAAIQLGYSPLAKQKDPDALRTNWAFMVAGTNYGLESSGPDLINGDNTGYGFGFMFEQKIAPSVGLLLEYGASQSALSQIQQMVNIAIGIEGPFGRRGDSFGFGYSWSKPSSEFAPRRREVQFFETYYRIQITDTWQLTPDLQVCFQPATGNPDPIVIFGLRLRTQF